VGEVVGHEGANWVALLDRQADTARLERALIPVVAAGSGPGRKVFIT
jgi:hypothetical protein